MTSANQLIPSPAHAAMTPDRLFAPTAQAAEREIEFFTAQINDVLYGTK